MILLSTKKTAIGGFFGHVIASPGHGKNGSEEPNIFFKNSMIKFFIFLLLFNLFKKNWRGGQRNLCQWQNVCVYVLPINVGHPCPYPDCTAESASADPPVGLVQHDFRPVLPLAVGADRSSVEPDMANPRP